MADAVVLLEPTATIVIFQIVIEITVAIIVAVQYMAPSKLVEADGRPSRARFCSRFLPVNGSFSLLQCLLIGESNCWSL